MTRRRPVIGAHQAPEEASIRRAPDHPTPSGLGLGLDMPPADDQKGALTGLVAGLQPVARGLFEAFAAEPVGATMTTALVVGAICPNMRDACERVIMVMMSLASEGKSR
jgi:hypothetical protein